MTGYEFLSAIYGDDAPGFLTIWATDKRTRWFRAIDLEQVSIVVHNLARQFDVYFGLGLQPESLGMKRRGTADTVSAIPGIWSDIDIASPGAHTETALPQSLAEAQEFLSSLPLSPTLVVHSGHGVYPFWLFHELWLLDSDNERREAHSLLRRWQRFIRDRGRQRGWKFDTTSDLARVLRPVGTINHKLDPVPVTCLNYYPARRYNPAGFTPYLPDEEYTPVKTTSSQDSDFAPASIWPIAAGCSWLRHCYHNAEQLSEPEWYAALTILARCRDAERLVHDFSRPYPDYTPEETQRKFEHALAAPGPRTCQYIRHELGAEDHCRRCVHWNKVTSPINLSGPSLTVSKKPSPKRKPAKRHRPELAVVNGRAVYID